MRLLNEIRHYMVNYHVKSGVYHYFRNEFKQALGFLRKALGDEASLSEDDRRHARCYLALSLKGLAEQHAARGELEESVEQLRLAAEASDYPDIRFLAGQLLERLGRRDEAVEAYRRAVAGNDGYLEARVALGCSLIEAGRLEEAGETFERALEIKIERLREPFGDGLARLRSGEREAALTRMHEVFRAAPRLADASLARALELLRCEEHERALAELDRAIDLAPRYPDLHNYRGIALCSLDRPAEAVAAFHRAAELCPVQVVPRLNAAFAHLRAGQIAEAETELESILRSRPDEPVATAKLAELRQVERRVPGARPAGA
jgi:Tfp pilus assembly protein PilF